VLSKLIFKEKEEEEKTKANKNKRHTKKNEMKNDGANFEYIYMHVRVFDPIQKWEKGEIQ
jgi:hypothetical protein